jgi:hypothetical protein
MNDARPGTKQIGTAGWRVGRRGNVLADLRSAAGDHAPTHRGTNDGRAVSTANHETGANSSAADFRRLDHPTYDRVRDDGNTYPWTRDYQSASCRPGASAVSKRGRSHRRSNLLRSWGSDPEVEGRLMRSDLEITLEDAGHGFQGAAFHPRRRFRPRTARDRIRVYPTPVTLLRLSRVDSARSRPVVRQQAINRRGAM